MIGVHKFPRVNRQPLDSGVQVQEHASWGAYHANILEIQHKQTPGVRALLPLFPDDSKSVAMMKHAMDVVRKATGILNEGQTPVITCDQPLYKIAKEIQWSYPQTHGESSDAWWFAHQNDTLEMSW